MDKFLIGSSLLGLSAIRDVDFLYIGEDKEFRVEDGNDNKHRTKEEQLELLQFQNDNLNKIFNYQLDQAINKDFGKFIPYNILDYKNELIVLLKEVVSKGLYNFSKRFTIKNKCCTKLIYHVAYNLFILENNSPIITDSQKEIIQKIHDGNMPIEYLDELETRIMALKEG